jgi:hypothetical protein
MSKIFKLFLGAIIITTIIASVSCNPDKEGEEEPGVTPNHMTYNGKDYELTKGTIENYGELASGTFNNDIMIMSGYTVHDASGEIDSLSGTGYLLYFEMFSSQGEKLDIGDYVYEADSMGMVKTFDYAQVAVNYDLSLPDGGTGSVLKDITAGTAKVGISGNEYEINFSGKDEDGVAVSFYYKGSLKYYDYSSKSSIKKKKF